MFFIMKKLVIPVLLSQTEFLRVNNTLDHQKRLAKDLRKAAHEKTGIPEGEDIPTELKEVCMLARYFHVCLFDLGLVFVFVVVFLFVLFVLFVCYFFCMFYN